MSYESIGDSRMGHSDSWRDPLGLNSPPHRNMIQLAVTASPPESRGRRQRRSYALTFQREEQISPTAADLAAGMQYRLRTSLIGWDLTVTATHLRQVDPATLSRRRPERNDSTIECDVDDWRTLEAVLAEVAMQMIERHGPGR